MRSFRLSLAISLLFLAPSLVWATEDDEPARVEKPPAVSGAFETDFASQYVWRGFALSEGPVMQPEASVSAYGVTATVWANFVLNDEPNQGEFNEVDPSLDYHGQWGKLEFEPSLEFYIFPNQSNAPTTGELSLWLGYPVGPVMLFTDHVFDIMEFAGAYYGVFGVDYERELVEKLSLQVSGAVGWASGRFNEAYGGVSHAALNVFLWDLQFVYSPLRWFYLRPHMQVSVLLDPDLRAASSDPTIVSGGLALGVSF